MRFSRPANCIPRSSLVTGLFISVRDDDRTRACRLSTYVLHHANFPQLRIIAFRYRERDRSVAEGEARESLRLPRLASPSPLPLLPARARPAGRYRSEIIIIHMHKMSFHFYWTSAARSTGRVSVLLASFANVRS